MNEHNIDNFMMLATNDKGTADRESKADHYYRGAYEEITSGKKVCWNWAAALLGSGWLLYRKMFAIYFLYLSVATLSVVSGGLLAFFLIEAHSSSYNLKIAIIVVFVVWYIICRFLILGFFGNWLHVRHIHKKIDKGYHLCPLKNTRSFLVWISIPFPLFEIPFIPFIAWNEKRKVKAVHWGIKVERLRGKSLTTPSSSE